MAYGTRSSRVRMDSINTLTFYNGELTAARRTSPVPQLECVGKPCKLYQPDVVQCTAVGRNGPDIEWKCQAELPSSIRFGRVQISCEGYDSPDDPFILKDSCGLTYNLVRVDPSLEKEGYPGVRSSRNYASQFTSKFFGNVFNLLTIAIFSYMLWVILIRPLLSYFTRNMPLATGSTGGGPPPPRRPWFGGLGGWGPGGGGGPGGSGGGSGRPGDAPPPPYSAKPDSTATGASTSSSIWSEIGRDMRRGAAIGVGSTIAEAGINSLLGRNRRNDQQQQQRFHTAPPMFAQPRQQSPFTNTWRSPFDRDDDRGEGGSGTSGLGSMRTSSGFGGTRNR